MIVHIVLVGILSKSAGLRWFILRLFYGFKMSVNTCSILLVSVLLIFSAIKAQASNATQSYSGFNTSIEPQIFVQYNDSANLQGQQAKLDNSTKQYSNDSLGLQPYSELDNSTEQYFNDSMNLVQVDFSPKEKRRRLITELTNAIAGRDEMKIQALSDPEHPYINATTGQCFNHVITSFSRACIVSKAFGGWRMFKGFFAVACKALGMKRQRITEYINRVCKKFPFLKI